MVSEKKKRMSISLPKHIIIKLNKYISVFEQKNGYKISKSDVICNLIEKNIEKSVDIV